MISKFKSNIDSLSVLKLIVGLFIHCDRRTSTRQSLMVHQAQDYDNSTVGCSARDCRQGNDNNKLHAGIPTAHAYID